MAKKAILDVLENTIGKYVLNLDSESLNVGVWSGKIELHSLQLDVKSINAELAKKAAEAPNLALPFRVIGGGFDSIEVDVPWSKLTSKPVVFRALGLRVNVEPYKYETNTGSNSKSNKKGSIGSILKRKRAKRKQDIEYADQSRLRANAISQLTTDGDNIDEKSSNTFTARLIRRIAENLQVEIGSVSISLVGCDASVGLILDGISLFTTDENGARSFVDRTVRVGSGTETHGTFLHKSLQIKGFGIYIDPLSTDDSKQKNNNRKHSYILSPLSLDASLRQSDSVRCITFPKYKLSSQLSKMSIELSRKQLELANQVALSLQPPSNTQKSRILFPEYRPLLPVSKETVKLWWRYAVRCIGRLSRRNSWTEFLIVFRKRQKYISLYKREKNHKDSSLNMKFHKPLDQKEKQILQNIESDHSISIDGLMVWRNLADQQLLKEKQKQNVAMKKYDEDPKKSSLVNSFFRTSDTPTSMHIHDDNSAPITLSIDEMKELEAINLEQVSDAVLSKDSQLCDVQFTLGSFKVNILNNVRSGSESSLVQLASFHMGVVETSFVAKNDGSYDFDFSLSSINIDDHVTKHTLFPSIVQSLLPASPYDSTQERKVAFHFQSKKQKEGDQDIKIRLVAFEVVASPQIIKEVKDFFTLDQKKNKKPLESEKAAPLVNPLMEQSVSTGDVDLFFDAMTGSTMLNSVSDIQQESEHDILGTKASEASAMVSDKISNALADAWNEKKVTKRRWKMDCIINAPIFVIPDCVTDPYALVLVLDMGNLNVTLRNTSTTSQIDDWFLQRMEQQRYMEEVDHLNLNMKNLSFMVSKCGTMDWKQSFSNNTDGKKKKQVYSSSRAVIEPLSISLSIGIENTTSENPLTCVTGFAPSIELKISPQQMTDIMHVISTWSTFGNELMGSDNDIEDNAFTKQDIKGTTILEASSEDQSIDSAMFQSSMVKTPQKKLSKISKQASKDKTSSDSPREYFYASFNVRHISAVFETEKIGKLEANLVSVGVSSTKYTDGSSQSRLWMGYFWVLDRLLHNYACSQRLVIHSELPQKPSAYSTNDMYEIIQDLQKSGALDENQSRSSGLADISLSLRPSQKEDRNKHENQGTLEDGSSPNMDTFINATFSSLFVNWNPRTIKGILKLQAKVVSSLNEVSVSSASSKGRSTIYSKDFSISGTPNRKSAASASSETAKSSTVKTVVNARMKKIELLLRSAKDDLPLFTLTMANFQTKLLTSSKTSESDNGEDESNIDAALSIGNIRINTYSGGRTHPDYETLIGLAANQSTSLLSIRYITGKSALANSYLSEKDKKKYKAYAELQLSPMRIVFIQSQILALTEFVTQGVLGSLTAEVASSAKAAAIEATQSSEGIEQLFKIKANGIDLVFPQAPNLKERTTMHAGSLVIWYRTLPKNAGGEAKISLTNVTMSCNDCVQIIETPIRMSIDVFLPPIENQSPHDRAMLIDIAFSKVPFVFSQSSYSQILHTLSSNLGEVDSFLRNEKDIYGIDKTSDDNDEESAVSLLNKGRQDLMPLTHSGVQAVLYEAQRLYVTLHFAELAIYLGGKEKYEPVVSLKAVDTRISYKNYPDEERVEYGLVLHTLKMEDIRQKSTERNFLRIINGCSMSKDQLNNEEAKQLRSDVGGEQQEDVLKLSYASSFRDGSTNIELVIGSPQFFVLPDVLSETRQFFQIEPNPSPPTPAVVASDQQSVVIDSSPGVEEIEASIETRSVSSSLKASSVNTPKTKAMKLSLKTSDIQIILVDMGSASKMDVSHNSGKSTLASVKELTETVVFQGQIEISTEMETDFKTDKFIEAKVQFQGDGMQVYTAEGFDLRSPVQVVEPVSGAVYLNKSIASDGFEIVEIKAVTLSRLDIIFSMRNAALLSAISSSIIDSLNSYSEKEKNTEDRNLNETQISEAELHHLEYLSSQLNSSKSNKDDSIKSVQSVRISLHPDTSDLPTAANKSTRQIIRVSATMPDAVLTIVNDLQGLDQALFKLIADNVVVGGDMSFPISETEENTKNAGPKFNFHFTFSLLADYFDVSTYYWESLLTKPWELTANALRTEEKKFKSGRFTTMLDIESHPLHISFSEQFLVGIGAAKKMWSTYSSAMKNAVAATSNGELSSDETKDEYDSFKKDMASNAARALVTTMPYGINNHSGLTVQFSVKSGEEDSGELKRQTCTSGSVQYFRFEYPAQKGIGGKRAYGQDVKHLKTLILYIGNSTLEFEKIDNQVNRPRRVHPLRNGRFIFSEIVNSGKGTIVYLTSHIHLYNSTNIPFSIAVQSYEGIIDVGVCHGRARSGSRVDKKLFVSSNKNDKSKSDDRMRSTKFASSLGISADFLFNFVSDSAGTSEVSLLDILICPHASDLEYDSTKHAPPRAATSLVGHQGSFRWGAISIPNISSLVKKANSKKSIETIEVLCSMPSEEMRLREVGKPMIANQSDSLCVQICVKLTMVDQVHPFVEIYIQPRALLENNLPINIMVRTPMTFTFPPPGEKGLVENNSFDLHDQVTHELEPEQCIEIFTPGRFISFTAMCSDSPSAGSVTGWAEGLVDVPLGPNRRLSDPVRCLFPFIGRMGEFIAGGGSEFYVMESSTSFDDIGSSKVKTKAKLRKKLSGSSDLYVSPEDCVRKVILTVQNSIVDHTGRVLFEEATDSKQRKSLAPALRNPNKEFLPWSAFSIPCRRITLLPRSYVPFYLLEVSINSMEGMSRSVPFKVEDIAICEGGAQSTAIIWPDNKETGYYAYRHLKTNGKSEVHVIPEFVIFNGSTENTIIVKQHRDSINISPGQIAPLSRDMKRDLILLIEVPDLCGATSPFHAETLGMQICIVKSNATGAPLGSFAVQTVLGSKDSRLVIKVGPVKFGGKERTSLESDDSEQRASENTFVNDFLRFRVRWTELKISLSDTQLLTQSMALLERDDSESDSESLPDTITQRIKTDLNIPQGSSTILAVVLHRFTIDYQRIFKENKSKKISMSTPERSQISVIIHNMQIQDCIPNSRHPIVIDGFTQNSIFDLCVRYRGPMNAEIVEVELLDLNIAYNKGQSDKIFINASEDFIWRLLDVAERINIAVSDLAGFQIELHWDETENEFVATIVEGDDGNSGRLAEGNEVGAYTAPRSDSLYNIKTARVSPFVLVFSFKRYPQASRYYKNLSSSPGAKLMNYFTRRLRFTIEKAELRIPGYISRSIKGPPDRVVETFSMYYTSRLKLQIVSLMTAISFQDWKHLTSRDSGKDNYEEGDVLRLAGNVVGRSTGYVFKKLGRGLGDGVSTITSTIGNEFEKSTEVVGAGAVGRRVNNLVSGAGDGISSAVIGVGTGAGNIVRGAGKGVGLIAGGVGGGVGMAAKGIGKGIISGDGEEIISGISKGAQAIGSGTAKGLETTAKGVGDGVMNVAGGLFSGVRHIGKGIGGAFTGKKSNSK